MSKKVIFAITDRKYRRHMILLGDWHFHPECSSWPKADYVEEDSRNFEELCLECMRRQLGRTSNSNPEPQIHSQSPRDGQRNNSSPSAGTISKKWIIIRGLKSR